VVNHGKQSFFSGHRHDSGSFFSPVALQPKLKIGSPNDKYERQADRVAEAVVSSPAPAIQQQRNENSGGILQRKCTECEKEEGLQMKSDSGAAAGNAPSAISQKIQNAGGGNNLSESVSSEMSQKIGADFSNVNIHTGHEASQLNQSLGARAFTHGNNIFFNSGEYNPGSREGKRLLAHELTHVVQQGTTSRGIQRKVIDENVTTTQPMLDAIGRTRQEVIQIINDADTDAITLADNSINALTAQLNNAQSGNAVDGNIEQILNEELGLSFNNPDQHRLIQQQIDRFTQIRDTLQSGYLRYHSLGLGDVSLVGCTAGNCDDAYAFSCPGNRLVVLCMSFWNEQQERGPTILHEPFHIWYHMAHHDPSALRRADASCFESFALRVTGRAAPASCVGHTRG
jgi:uncharacterized protein YidB (DUF937 family)